MKKQKLEKIQESILKNADKYLAKLITNLQIAAGISCGKIPILYKDLTIEECMSLSNFYDDCVSAQDEKDFLKLLQNPWSGDRQFHSKLTDNLIKHYNICQKK